MLKRQNKSRGPSPKQVFSAKAKSMAKYAKRNSLDKFQSSDYLPMIMEPKKHRNARNVARSTQFRSIDDTSTIQKFLKGPKVAVQDALMTSSIMRDAKISTRGSKLMNYDANKPITPLELTAPLDYKRGGSRANQSMLKTVDFKTLRIKSDLERPIAA